MLRCCVFSCSPLLLSFALTASVAANAQRPAQRPRLVLDVLDVDRNGTLTADEIQAAGTHLIQLDKNHDGVISPDEMPMRQQSPAQRTSHILNEFDVNHDGKLSTEEVPDGLRNRFAEADKNGDGFLDRSELEQMFAAMPAGGARRGSENGPQSDGAQPKGPNN